MCSLLLLGNRHHQEVFNFKCAVPNQERIYQHIVNPQRWYISAEILSSFIMFSEIAQLKYCSISHHSWPGNISIYKLAAGGAYCEQNKPHEMFLILTFVILESWSGLPANLRTVYSSKTAVETCKLLRTMRSIGNVLISRRQQNFR